MDKIRQLLISVGVVLAVSTLAFTLSDLMGYRVVAFLLLVVVSVLAMLFDIIPVLTAALLSAMVWDFFFIPPRYNFHVDSTEDLLMLLMYLFVALINAVLSIKIRQMEKAARIKEEKEKSIRLYNTVLNSLSHELRTPIATILGAADGLMQPGSKLSEDNKKALIGEIATASVRLNLQVENLLNMSRLESGFIRPKMDWCDVNELVYSVVNRLEVRSDHHQLEVVLPENLPLFRLDFGMMDQIIQNILNNALQHTPEGSRIAIQAAHREGGFWLSISDNGKGFPPQELEKAFDKFYRLPHAPTGGIGLGLSIVKGFVAAQGGIVELKNREGGGAEFVITIPTEISYLNIGKDED